MWWEGSSRGRMNMNKYTGQDYRSYIFCRFREEVNGSLYSG
jgi:hypothetical protein